MQPTTLTVSIDDIDLAYTVIGGGVPLIVVHGAAGLGSTYMRGLDRWSPDFQLVYYDQRGTGGTPVGDPARLTFRSAIAELDAMRAALGVERVNLVGHSLGAHLAAMYAGTHPETMSSLVMLNTGPPLRPDLMQAFGQNSAARRTAADDEARQQIEGSAMFEARDPQALEQYTLNTFSPFFRDRSAFASARLGFTDNNAANPIVLTPQVFLQTLFPLDPIATYVKIDCPTLVVHSELDTVPVEWAHVLRDTIPGADYALLDGASHFAHIEDFDQLTEAVVPWLHKHAG